MGGPHGGGGPHGTPLRLGTRSRHGRRAPREAALHGGRQRQIRGSVPSHVARVLEVRIQTNFGPWLTEAKVGKERSSPPAFFSIVAGRAGSRLARCPVAHAAL